MPSAAVSAAASIGSAVIGSRGKKKAQKDALSAARAQEERIRAEQQRIEEKFGLTPEEREREQRALDLEKARLVELQRRAGLTGEDLLREGGPITQQFLEDIAARQGLTSSELFAREGGAPAESLLRQLSSEDPLAPFQGELDLVLQKVNQDAQRRGVFGGLPQGGIRFEQLGRAGVDLAIKSARERLAQQSALASQLFNIASQQRAEAGTIGERALTEAGGARSDIQNFLSNLQTLGQSSRQRAAGVGLSAFGTAEKVASPFQQVPLSLAGFDLAQAQRQKSEGLGGLRDVVGSVNVGDLFRRKSPSVNVSDIAGSPDIGQDFGRFKSKPLTIDDLR